MTTNDDFEGLEENEISFTKQKKRQRTGVIKSGRNKVKGTLHLEPTDETEHGIEFFQPIMEGELVVGVIHKCSCGKISELRFQYSD